MRSIRAKSVSAGRRLFLVSVKVWIQRRCYLYIFQLCVDENRSLFEFVHTYRVDGQTRGYNQGMSPLYFPSSSLCRFCYDDVLLPTLCEHVNDHYPLRSPEH